MLKYGLFAVICFCFAAMIYFLFFKKSALDERLLRIQNMSAISVSEEEEPVLNRTRHRFEFLRVPEKVRETILSAGIMLRVEEFVMIWISLTLVPGLLYYIVFGNIFGSFVIVAISAAIPPFYINRARGKRLAAFGTQLGDALLLISNGLRAGFSFEQVLETVAEEMPMPISQEFARVSRELKMGMTMEYSLMSLTERMENTDMRLLTSAVLIQRQVGGNLAEILDTISGTIQERIKIKKNIKTITAQGKISGIVIGAIPIVLFVLLSIINAEYMSMFYESLIGKILMGIAIVMEVLGFLVIRKMVTI